MWWSCPDSISPWPNDTLHVLQTRGRAARRPCHICGKDSRTSRESGWASWVGPGISVGRWKTHMKRGHRLPGLSSLWAPAVMALERGPLLLLTLSLGLASAQKTLEELPVQPGFDAQKVQGRWLTIQLAASHAHLVSPADPLRLALHSIWTWDGDLQFVLFWTRRGVQRGKRHRPSGWAPRPVPRLLEAAAYTSARQHQLQQPHPLRPLPGRRRDHQPVGTAGNLTPARRMLRDPEGLEKYLEDVAEFQLQKAPVFNLDGKRCPQPFPLAPRQAGPRSGASSFGPGTPT
ncbi:hypothetical protein HPG69_015622, partial [Diceros bicornis minor]